MWEIEMSSDKRMQQTETQAERARDCEWGQRGVWEMIVIICSMRMKLCNFMRVVPLFCFI